ncbi:hypothetical protein AMK59_1829 [Oryctes borbonicus]|uniref:dolichyl-P-Man:Man5GlcNAc2-PP-dolichol alpha-1,3-mannosyltransferase n=1 Tax=Oryctes borbonicus TaxID=1629725 RepID=A0A0T6BBQ7_9SCAR|nr:hypothetical protein AMK59_1829 [Oryctes borbonicus]
MARPKNNTARNGTPVQFGIFSYIKQYASMTFLKKLAFDPSYLYVTCWALIVFEIILNIFIIQRVKYTEIDWIAYMQEVEGFINGTLDYKHLKGDTGPLVYPAGFVYIYSALYYVTSNGQNIRLAQYIFVVLYVSQLYLTFQIFCKTKKIPPYAVVLSTLTSYRIHSIFVLRLFNDPIAVLLFYISISLFLKNEWIAGSIFYSLAVSVKMNILLYAPCLLIAYLTNLSFFDTMQNLFICGLVQLILGLPFLYENYWSYIKGSFDLGRVFEYKWTVNYRFLDRTFFENRFFHISLLALHIILLLIFLPAIKRYLSSYAKLYKVIDQLRKDTKKKDDKVQKELESLTKSQQRVLDS